MFASASEKVTCVLSLLSSSSPPQDVGEVATLAEREFFGEQVRSRNQHARPLKTLLLIHLSTPRV